MCHYCRHEKPVLEICPVCASSNLVFSGSGTQKVEDEVVRLFPQAKVLRMDVDTTRGRGKHHQILMDFGSGKADILLGTQMIAKGLDFENVTLVGLFGSEREARSTHEMLCVREDVTCFVTHTLDTVSMPLGTS